MIWDMQYIAVIAILFLTASPAHAWNALGHKVIADIAWQQLDEPTRAEIVRTLRRHPHLDDDFAEQGDIGSDRWVFQHAATWPDHQPMHAVFLYSERFPEGDRGGNAIPLVQGDNLHALWDNLLGRQHHPNDVKREVAELKARPDLWKVEIGDVNLWRKESQGLAESFAYSPKILEATRQPGELAKIQLPEAYLKESGEHARQRVVAAGLRLGVLLGGSAEPAAAEPVPEFEFAARKPKPMSRPMSLTPAASELTHWLNTNGNVRHNSGCRWYQNTKKGRACAAGEGKACGQCGG
jgi:hypothetical protein